VFQNHTAVQNDRNYETVQKLKCLKTIQKLKCLKTIQQLSKISKKINNLHKTAYKSFIVKFNKFN